MLWLGNRHRPVLDSVVKHDHAALSRAIAIDWGEAQYFLQPLDDIGRCRRAAECAAEHAAAQVHLTELLHEILWHQESAIVSDHMRYIASASVHLALSSKKYTGAVSNLLRFKQLG